MDALPGGILSLQVNRGGKLDPREVIGRQQDLDKVVRALDRQSVLLAAERRIGKTTLCRQAESAIAPYACPIFKDIEGVDNTAELVGSLMGEILPRLNRQDRWKRQSSHLYQRFEGKSITLPDWLGGGGFSLPSSLHDSWKEILKDGITDLIEAQTTGKNAQRYVCLFLDEFPVALENIAANQGNRMAMSVLDLLRELREENGDRLRFVFTGSIGIHHLLRRLHREGYANQPLNNVLPISINTLKPADAHQLALGLLHGAQLSVADHDATASAIVEQACAFPFYIHHIVGALQDDNLATTPENVTQIVTGQITSPLDPWKMRDYKTRLIRHFPETRPVALELLNILAVNDALPFDQIVQRIRLKEPIKDTEEDIIGETLDLLEQDFYIERDLQQIYRFRRPLLARAWRHLQRLPERGGASHV